MPLVGYYAGQPCDGKDDADSARGCIRVKQGVSQGPTRKGVEAIVDFDSAAYWNGSKIVTTYDVSPRIVPIPLFDPDDFVNNQGSCSGSNCVIKVVNIMGFFVEGMCEDVVLDAGTKCSDPKKDVVGRMVGHLAQFKGGSGTTPVGNSFATVVRLVR